MVTFKKVLILYSASFAVSSSILVLEKRELAKRFLNLSIRPAVSTYFILPVKNGCEVLEISTLINGYSLPSSQAMVSLEGAQDLVKNASSLDTSLKITVLYAVGWISFFIIEIFLFSDCKDKTNLTILKGRNTFIFLFLTMKTPQYSRFSFLFSYLLVFFGFSSLQSQVPFECDGNFFLSLTDNGQSQFYTLEINPATGGVDFNPLGTTSGFRINAVGYRSTDNLIYGVSPINAQFLYQIDAMGQVVDLGLLNGLSTPPYYAGDVTPDGNFLCLLGNGGSVVSTVRLNSGNFETTNTALSTNSGRNIFCTDMAFDPISGEIYSFDAVWQRLVKIDLSNNTIDDETYPTTNAADGIGALFFDSFGSLWGYGDAPGEGDARNLYQINIETGSVVLRENGPPSPGKDGCSCPYNVQMQKTVTPTVAVSCSEVSYQFLIANLSGDSQTGIDFIDELPTGMTITEITRNPYTGNVISGVGTNELRIENMEVTQGIDSIVIKVFLENDLEGIYKNQAKLFGLPDRFGGETFSDDPLTLIRPDSTALIVTPLTVNFNNNELPLCLGDTLLLEPISNGTNFTWSTGATNSSIMISEPGNYSVTVTNDCEMSVDEILVTQESQVLNLGDDTTIALGEELILRPQYFGFNNPVFSWSADQPAIDLCIDCPRPIIRPVFTTVYKLEMQDSLATCNLQDSIVVTVTTDREVFAPNAFSPNGDGVNDFFTIYAKGPVIIKRLEIFNRWGDLVFIGEGMDTNNEQLGWDGFFKNERMNTGVYIWQAELEFLDGVVERKFGDVLLVR